MPFSAQESNIVKIDNLADRLATTDINDPTTEDDLMSISESDGHSVGYSDGQFVGQSVDQSVHRADKEEEDQSATQNQISLKSNRMLSEFSANVRSMSVEERSHRLTMIFIEKIREKDVDALRRFYLTFSRAINPHYNHEEPFRTACTVGDYATVRFMYDEIGNIDLTAFNHEAFHMSCLANNIEVALWIQNIDGRYRVVMSSNTQIDHEACKFIDEEADRIREQVKRINETRDYMEYVPYDGTALDLEIGVEDADSDQDPDESTGYDSMTCSHGSA